MLWDMMLPDIVMLIIVDPYQHEYPLLVMSDLQMIHALAFRVSSMSPSFQQKLQMLWSCEQPRSHQLIGDMFQYRQSLRRPLFLGVMQILPSIPCLSFKGQGAMQVSKSANLHHARHIHPFISLSAGWVLIFKQTAKLSNSSEEWHLSDFIRHLCRHEKSRELALFVHKTKARRLFTAFYRLWTCSAPDLLFRFHFEMASKMLWFMRIVYPNNYQIRMPWKESEAWKPWTRKHCLLTRGQSSCSRGRRVGPTRCPSQPR